MAGWDNFSSRMGTISLGKGNFDGKGWQSNKGWQQGHRNGWQLSDGKPNESKGWSGQASKGKGKSKGKGFQGECFACGEWGHSQSRRPHAWNAPGSGEFKGKGKGFSSVAGLEIGTAAPQGDEHLSMGDAEISSLERASQQDSNFRWVCTLKPVRTCNKFAALSRDIEDEDEEEEMQTVVMSSATWRSCEDQHRGHGGVPEDRHRRYGVSPKDLSATWRSSHSCTRVESTLCACVGIVSRSLGIRRMTAGMIPQHQPQRKTRTQEIFRRSVDVDWAGMSWIRCGPLGSGRHEQLQERREIGHDCGVGSRRIGVRTTRRPRVRDPTQRRTASRHVLSGG